MPGPHAKLSTLVSAELPFPLLLFVRSAGERTTVSYSREKLSRIIEVCYHRRDRRTERERERETCFLRFIRARAFRNRPESLPTIASPKRRTAILDNMRCVSLSERGSSAEMCPGLGACPGNWHFYLRLIVHYDVMSREMEQSQSTIVLRSQEKLPTV